MTRNKIIENVIEYQKCFQYRPLTCGIDSDHKLLEPKVENGKIILECPTCGYKQNNIPKFVKHFDELRTDVGCLI